uniref:F-box domain-containing protein n=1 Tax=Aegilops tauschii subsp. strangulata TaxID=200361 RepID=A0A453GHA1_AEGTS
KIHGKTSTQNVRSGGTMEGEAQPPPACVSKVLDEDNLLREIIVRVGFPTSLVRAAGVCTRWLSHASDRALLRRFRELHPPRLLGFYLAKRERPGGARFFPVLPLPPDLAAVVRRASFSLDAHEGARRSAGFSPDTHSDGRSDVVGCWNGSVLTSSQGQNYAHGRSEIMFQVHSPLCSGSEKEKKGMACPTFMSPWSVPGIMKILRCMCICCKMVMMPGASILPWPPTSFCIHAKALKACLLTAKSICRPTMKLLSWI